MRWSPLLRISNQKANERAEHFVHSAVLSELCGGVIDALLRLSGKLIVGPVNRGGAGVVYEALYDAVKGSYDPQEFLREVPSEISVGS